MGRNKKIEEEIANKLINSLLIGGKDGMMDGLYNLVQNGIIRITPQNDKLENNQSNSKNLDQISKIANREGLDGGLAGIVNASISSEDSQTITPNEVDLERGSLYKSIHRPIAMEENGIGAKTEKKELEEPKARILERRSSAPNPWEDAAVVTPGQLKL